MTYLFFGKMRASLLSFWPSCGWVWNLHTRFSAGVRQPHRPGQTGHIWGGFEKQALLFTHILTESQIQREQRWNMAAIMVIHFLFILTVAELVLRVTNSHYFSATGQVVLSEGGCFNTWQKNLFLNKKWVFHSKAEQLSSFSCSILPCMSVRVMLH